MRIIEKIEINKFRSIGESESFECFDLNIFSGSNDSGKSNFLKAINLFFNGQSDIDTRYNSESDFNKWYRDNSERGQRTIEITVQIAKGKYGDQSGINKGFRTKKIFRVDGGYHTLFYSLSGNEIKQGELSHRKASAIINEKIRYVYIPAIRDAQFRENVQRLIQEIANSTDKRFRSQDLKDAFTNMEKGIDSQLAGLTDYVKEKMNIEIETNVNFGTLLESLTFETKEEIKIKKRKGGFETQKVSVQNRGDGIQMQFFTLMLWFISKNDTKHFYIWGYEEPEIAFEFKRQFELAEIFEDSFSHAAQIFLTTHSPAFALAEGNERTKVFRVNYEKDKRTTKNRFTSRVVAINEYYEGLFRELTSASADNKKSLERDIWGINVQKISRSIGESMNEIMDLRQISKSQLDELKSLITQQQNENKLLASEIQKIEDDLKKLFPEKVFICEDEKALKLWENMLFEKMGIDREKFKIISSKGCANNEVEIALLHLRKEKNDYSPMVFRQFDGDGFIPEQIVFIESRKQSNTNFQKFKGYKAKFLPVNEIENFAVLIDSYFTEDKLKEYNFNNNITDAFIQTTTSNIKSAQKLCRDKEEFDLFNGQDAKMIQYARTNLKKFFPGKEIKRLKPNFNTDEFLIGRSFSELPIELQTFLNDIKDFFEPTTLPA